VGTTGDLEKQLKRWVFKRFLKTVSDGVGDACLRGCL